ncbi:hypothetical protein KIL84_003832 [Mauremys mutica]|uniref:Uncharacterized protein n=1 Tax=Mauremys mutica TaxID=74926 RepID=A0A9D3WUI7_9SAUR|nr:hypothetical protein KIL84_003832 [Mauremys mutica]
MGSRSHREPGGRAKNQPQVSRAPSQCPPPTLPLLCLTGFAPPTLLSRTPWTPCPGPDICQPVSVSPSPSPTLLPHSVHSPLCSNGPLLFPELSSCSPLHSGPQIQGVQPALLHGNQGAPGVHVQGGDPRRGEAKRCHLGPYLPVPGGSQHQGSLCLSSSNPPPPHRRNQANAETQKRLCTQSTLQLHCAGPASNTGQTKQLQSPREVREMSCARHTQHPQSSWAKSSPLAKRA